MDGSNNVAIIIPYSTNPNCILLQKKDSGYKWFPGGWCFFGGKIEEGEKPPKAIIRECQEELGLVLDENSLEYLGTEKFNDVSINGETREGTFQVFAIKIELKEFLKKIQLGEGAGFASFEENELGSLYMPPNNKHIAVKFLNHLAPK